MRITNRDKRYQIDRAAYTAFLREQGFCDDDIDMLCVYIHEYGGEAPIQKPGMKATLLGRFCRPHSIFIYTHGWSARDINDALLHETRHYWQHVEHMRRPWPKNMTKRQQQKFLHTWLAEETQDRDIAYEERPSEIDARQFATQYGHVQLVTRVDEVPEKKTVAKSAVVSPAPTNSEKPKAILPEVSQQPATSTATAIYALAVAGLVVAKAITSLWR